MNEIVILLGADGDLIEHYNRFEDRSAGLGEAFDEAFVRSCGLLQAFPEIAARWRGGFRRFLMLDWNLGIFYSLSGRRILIHGIMDTRQDPKNIERRLGLR